MTLSGNSVLTTDWPQGRPVRRGARPGSVNGVLTLCHSRLLALVARNHGEDQILAMPEARQNHSGDMGENERERDVGDDHVRLLHRLAGVFGEHPGERPRLMFPAINHKAGYHRRCKEEKKENHHGAAARAMPEMALGTK